MNTLNLKPGQLTLADLRAAYQARVHLTLDAAAHQAIDASVACVNQIIAEGRTAYDDSILSHVSRAGAKLSMRDILASIGGTPNQIRASLGRLIEKGLIAWEGRTRNTTYFVPGLGAST